MTDRIPNDGMQFIKSLDPKTPGSDRGRHAGDGATIPGGKAVLKSLYNYDASRKSSPTFYNDFAAVLKKAGVDPQRW